VKNTTGLTEKRKYRGFWAFFTHTKRKKGIAGAFERNNGGFYLPYQVFLSDINAYISKSILTRSTLRAWERSRKIITHDLLLNIFGFFLLRGAGSGFIRHGSVFFFASDKASCRFGLHEELPRGSPIRRRTLLSLSENSLLWTSF